MQKRTTLFLCLLMFGASAHADVLDGWRKAKAAVDRGVIAMGGAEALRAKKQVSMKFAGTEWRVGQSMHADGALDTVVADGAIYIDTEKQRAVLDNATRYIPDYVFSSRTILDGATGTNLNIEWKLATPLPNAASTYRSVYRGRPHLLMLTAQSRETTLRWLGEEDGLQAVAFSDSDGSVSTIYLEATSGLLRKVVSFFSDPIRGDVLAETTYPDYKAVDGVQMPARMVRKENGVVVRELVFSDIRFNAPIADSELKTPEDFRGPIDLGTEIKATKIGDGVWTLTAPDPTMMMVETADGVYVIEGAPQETGYAERMLAKVRETFPGKPVKGLILSHWHHDHSGGVRAYIAAGIPIITTPANAKWVQRAAKEGKRTISPDTLARNPREPIVETFEKRKTIGPVELIELTDSPHAASMVMSWFPKEKILYQSDLLILPRERDVVMSPIMNKYLLAQINRLKLAPKQIIGYHGRAATLDELKSLQN